MTITSSQSNSGCCLQVDKERLPGTALQLEEKLRQSTEVEGVVVASKVLIEQM